MIQDKKENSENASEHFFVVPTIRATYLRSIKYLHLIIYLFSIIFVPTADYVFFGVL